jgi:hypothetical protein
LNFIGHLHVARARSDDPSFGLGAMAPDFASMARVRLSQPSSAAVRAGIAFHHATDDLFHRADAFVSLLSETFARMIARGVGRGPARAVSHVGVELLLDGELLRDGSLDAPYLDALSAFEAHAADLAQEPSGRARLSLMCARLSEHGVPHEYRNTEAVLGRLERTLRGRPRLALDAAARTAAGVVLAEMQPRVRGVTGEIVAFLARMLPKDVSL